MNNANPASFEAKDSLPIFALKWKEADTKASQVVADLEQYLDHRKKSLKDSDTNKAILTALLAYRGGPFQVRMMDLPKDKKAPVRDAIDCLKGDVLLSRGTSVFELRPEFSFLKIGGKVRTAEATTTELETTWGSVYRDGTHSEVPFSNILRLGYTRPSLVTVVAPHRHWSIFFDGEPAPSRNWREIEEGDQHDQSLRNDKIMDEVVSQAKRGGVVLVRYGEAGFICQHSNQAAFYIDNTLTRMTGKTGFRPLLEVTDQYQRKDFRWGSKS
ncbi:hypothetical protein N9H60_03640 [Flavimaricola sp.]|nr:hypothetical protein [Flavimaricola sp.]MDA9020249.1 hypothetical protein [Flavimaricola sp.]